MNIFIIALSAIAAGNAKNTHQQTILIVQKDLRFEHSKDYKRMWLEYQRKRQVLVLHT